MSRIFAKIPNLDALKKGAAYRPVHEFSEPGDGPQQGLYVELEKADDMLTGVFVDETNDVIASHLNWWAGELERIA